MAAIHKFKIVSDFIKAGAISPELLRELFRTVTESLAYEVAVASGVTATSLPGFGSSAGQITTIQTFIFITDTTVTLNWNGANISMVVAAGDRFAVFVAYGVSTTTVPTITNAGSTTATITVIAGGL